MPCPCKTCRYRPLDPAALCLHPDYVRLGPGVFAGNTPGQGCVGFAEAPGPLAADDERDGRWLSDADADLAALLEPGPGEIDAPLSTAEAMAILEGEA